LGFILDTPFQLPLIPCFSKPGCSEGKVNAVPSLERQQADPVLFVMASPIHWHGVADIITASAAGLDMATLRLPIPPAHDARELSYPLPVRRVAPLAEPPLPLGADSGLPFGGIPARV
jgi:hypothetical protein